MVLKEYKFGFNIYGLLLFLIIMILNFIWFAIPAPNDVLRAESVTEVIDIIASVCQVLMLNTGIILGLTISPCMAFLFFAIDRKNMIAVVPISIFLICHLIYGIANFVV